MTVELADNLVQLAALAVCVTLAFVRLTALLGHRDKTVAQTDHIHDWALLLGSYCCDLLTLCYWVLCLLAFGWMPLRFYVSDLGWMACYLFLLMLMVSCDLRRAPQPPVRAAWLVPLAVLPQFALYVTHGDWLNNLVHCLVMGAIAFFAVRGVCSAGCDGRGGFAFSRAFHASVLAYAACEFAVWTTSCFWGTDALTPYIVADFAFTLANVVMLARAWKVRP